MSRRIWFTLGALLIYRVGTHVPIPGLPPGAELFPCDNPWRQYIFGCSPAPLGFARFFDLLTGGALGRVSIFSLSIIPYLAAAAVVQLAAGVVAKFTATKTEGEIGKKLIHRYARYGTVLVAALLGYCVAVGIERLNGWGGVTVSAPGPVFRLTTVVTLTGGTIFLMWLSNHIGRRGLCDGIPLIIFSGLVMNVPAEIWRIRDLGRTGALPIGVVTALLAVAVAMVVIIVLTKRARRRVVLDEPGGHVGGKQPRELRLNAAGAIPPIYALSLVATPLMAAGFVGGAPSWYSIGAPFLGWEKLLYFGFSISAMVFFVVSLASRGPAPVVTVNSAGAAVDIKGLSNRLGVIAAVLLTIVCLSPEPLIALYSVPFQMGGMGMLILVWVTLDVIERIRRPAHSPAA